MPKLDDVSWHLDAAGEPDETAEVRAALHIGLFLAWVAHREDWKGIPGLEAAPIAQVRTRQTTGTQFLLEHCDGKLYTEMLTPDAASFAESYYPKKFLQAYAAIVRSHGLQEYQVPDDWLLYDEVARALESAAASGARKQWWRPW